MIISSFTLYLYIAIALLGGFALGAWFRGLFFWFPFGSGPVTGKESMLGKLATVLTVKPDYVEVIYDSRVWRAKVIGREVPTKNEKVVIRDVQSNTLMIEPLGLDDQPPQH